MSYPLLALLENPVIMDRLAGVDIVVTHWNGSAQAFRTAGRAFVPEGDCWMTDVTGLRWDRVTGISTSGERLESVESFWTMWFAWASFHPGSGVFGGLRPSAFVKFLVEPLEPVFPLGANIRAEVTLNNTLREPLSWLNLTIGLPPGLLYVSDGAGATGTVLYREAAARRIHLALRSLPPGEVSFPLTARVVPEELQGTMLHANLRLTYPEPGGGVLQVSGQSLPLRIGRPSPQAGVPPLVMALIPMALAIACLARRRRIRR